MFQVIKKYQLGAPSMEQLQTHYAKHFGEPLPLAQYMSLYDSCQSSVPKKLPTQPEPTADPVTVVWDKTPGGQHTHFSDSDFPVLGTDASLTKEQKSKMRDATQGEGRLPVFRDAYHAQLREVHRTNMQAVQAMEEDEEELTGRRRKRVLDQDSVNSLMEDVIREIAAKGDLVTKDKVRRKWKRFESFICLFIYLFIFSNKHWG